MAHCELFAAWQAQLVIARRQSFVAPSGVRQLPTPNPIHRMAARTQQQLLSLTISGIYADVAIESGVMLAAPARFRNWP